MMQTEQPNTDGQGGLVDAPRLLVELFPNPECRPSLRWLRTEVAERTLPFVRIGRLCFFDTQMVKTHFAARAMSKVKGQ
jgi:hypothetical protein